MYIPEQLIRKLEPIKQMVFDFEGTLIPSNEYFRLAKHYILRYSLLRPENILNVEKWEIARRFSSSIHEYSPEEQVRTTLLLCENAPEKKVFDIGQEFTRHIRPSIKELLSRYPEKYRAVISFDDYRGVYATMSEIGATKGITNLMLSRKGKITTDIVSIGINVWDWKYQNPMYNGQDRLRAFMAVLESSGIEPREAAYFGDGYSDFDIMDFLNREGGVTVGIHASKVEGKTQFLVD